MRSITDPVEMPGWAHGTDIHLQLLDGQEIYMNKITILPDVKDGGYWEVTRVNTPAIPKSNYVGKGIYQGMRMEVIDNLDATFYGYVIVKDAAGCLTDRKSPSGKRGTYVCQMGLAHSGQTRR